MIDPNFIILYVDSPELSARFYADLLGKPPVENSPNFALFVLDTGLKFGLWARHDVQPGPVNPKAGAGEMAFAVADAETVTSLHSEWRQRGITIAQAPTAMDFGFTFVGLDPDGHRLRVFTPSAA